MENQIHIFKDIIQQVEGNLKIPEIRVWCHPAKGDDYYYAFETFKEALKFIKENKIVEKVPLLAFRGYEINLFALENVKWEKENEKIKFRIAETEDF